MATYATRDSFLAALYSGTGTARHNFQNAVLDHLDLHGVNARHCDWTSASMVGTNWKGGDLSDCIWTSATVTLADISSALVLSPVGLTAAQIAAMNTDSGTRIGIPNPPDNYDSFTS